MTRHPYFVLALYLLPCEGTHVCLQFTEGTHPNPKGHPCSQWTWNRRMVVAQDPSNEDSIIHSSHNSFATVENHKEFFMPYGITPRVVSKLSSSPASCSSTPEQSWNVLFNNCRSLLQDHSLGSLSNMTDRVWLPSMIVNLSYSYLILVAACCSL